MSIVNKRQIRLVFIIIAVYLIISLCRNIWRLEKSKERIKEAETRREELEREREELAQKLRYLESDEFLEKQARDKLLMAKKGETVVILPEEIQEIAERVEVGVEEKEIKENWRKWLKLFWF